MRSHDHTLNYLMLSPFNNLSCCLFDNSYKYENIRVNIVYQVFQFAKLKPGNDGKNDIAIAAHIILVRQEPSFAFVSGNSAGQFVYQLVFDDITFHGYNG